MILRDILFCNIIYNVKKVRIIKQYVMGGNSYEDRINKGADKSIKQDYGYGLGY